MVSLRCAVLLLICIAAWTPWGAQAFDTEAYTFQLSRASGVLSAQSIHSIFQDSAGFIWLLTPEGLNRYDGYEVIRHIASSKDPESLSHHRVTGIAEDPAGDFWIATWGGLNRLDAASGRFSRMKAADSRSAHSPLSDKVASLFKASDSTLWLGYDDVDGFSNFDPATKRFEHFYPPSGGGEARFSSFTEYPAGVLWAAADNLGLVRIEAASGSTDVIPVRTNADLEKATRIKHIMADSRGALWLSTAGQGLFRYDVADAGFTHYVHTPADPTSLSADTVHMTTEDSAGNVWAATGQGINVLTRDTGSFVRIDPGNSVPPFRRVQSLLEDDSGIIWVGTSSGLAMGTRSLFTRVDRALSGLSSESVNAFTETADGRIWVGTNKGVDYLQGNRTAGENGISVYQPELPTGAVMSLLGEDDVLWIGTLKSGLIRVDLATGQRSQYQMRTGDPFSLSANGITSILRTSDGQLLVGTYGGGLNLFNEKSGSFQHYRSVTDDPNSISSDKVLALLEDSLGNLLVGTDSGLNLFDLASESFISFRHDPENGDSLSGKMAWSLHEDARGDLWVGTQNAGVNRWARDDRVSVTNRFENFGTNINLPGRAIYAITSDSHGRLWLTHSLGLSRFDPTSLKVHNFGTGNGLQSTEFNHAAGFRDSQGNMYFGDSRGFNIIESGTDIQSAITPPLVMTDCRILADSCDFGTPYHRLEQIELTHKDLMATFTFALLDYANPFSTTYRYRLEEFDKDWIELGTRRTVSLTSMPAGSYILRVQGTGSDGDWSENEIRLSINVLPPPWRSWWAISLYVVVCLSVIYYQYRKRKRAQ